ncbi:MAG: hypothetical protein H8D75_00390 [Rhodospirillaceae bacterium]|nr:hypothetical protein [Rhodospirillaceae bacterium]
MALFLSVAAFLLSVSAVVVGAEALRRINGQNEEFLKAYVKQIRADLERKDEEMILVKKEIQELKRSRQANRETLRKLEQGTKRKRDAESEQFVIEPQDKYGDFIPSSSAPRKRNVA